MRQTTKAQSGFTLIELSIVLVIIGLIVGGVLIGRDMIETAKIRSQISQIEKINTAANTFRSKFGSVPGDLSSARGTSMGLAYATHAVTPNLAENGLVDGDDFTALESWYFFYNLAEAKLYNCSSCVIAYDNGGANATWDAVFTSAVVNNNNIMMVYGGKSVDSPNVSAVSDFSKNYIEIGPPAASANLAMTPNQAYSIDVKIDDGMPTTGKVKPVDSYILTGWPDLWRTTRSPSSGAYGSANCVNTDSTPNSYNSPISALLCDLRIEGQF